jgi:nifR3 family TIM-barrel protein
MFPPRRQTEIRGPREPARDTLSKASDDFLARTPCGDAQIDYDVSMLPVAQTLVSRSRGLSVGAWRFKGRSLLAPMSGVTDLGMRRLAQRFGATLTVSEMVDSDFYASGDVASAVKADGAGIDCHVAQIAGCDAARLADAARRARDQGAAIVDINMGCPAKKVVGGLAGSALMRDLDQAVALIRAVVAAAPGPVTVKMRLGWDEATRNAPELARRAEAEGVAMVTVHGRTRCQFYKGRADWAAIGAVKAAVTIPVVANGDCGSIGDARAMLAASGADAVMIGRAALGRPWLVGDIAHALETGAERPPPSLETRKQAALEHYDCLLSLYGAGRGVRHARKHLAAYALHAGADPASNTAHAMLTSEDPAHVRALLSDLFDATDDISNLEEAA